MTTPPEAAPDVAGVPWHRRTLRRLNAVWKWAITREQLDRIQPGVSANRRFARVARWLVEPEFLAQDYENLDGAGQPFLPWLSAAEDLSHKQSSTEVVQKPFFRWLVTSEELRKNHRPSSPTRAKSFFSWLLGSEPLPRATETTPNREAPHQ